ncbi:hypothetical protein KM043_004427 [Ampulex compressa]|nr:hypothetical protein KM043_004427 [Ampulex compressa]
MAYRVVGKNVGRYLIGKCVPSSKTNAAKVQIQTPQLDKYLLMYFNKYHFLYAHDPEGLCKTGDTVLIQSLPEKLSRLISHKVVEVVYPLGDVTDPITGKKVIAGKYRDEIDKINDAYGKHDQAFNYEDAPPRGRLEGTQDITDKKTYPKYYEDPDDPQPYAV